MTDTYSPSPAAGGGGQPGRLHALDAVRACALLLGVVLHAGMSMISGFPIWVIQDSQAQDWMGLTFFVPHLFRMTLFFLIAGYFARLAVNKKGLGSFTLDRAKRIALPLITLWLPIFALIATVFVWGAIRANGGEAPEAETPPLTVHTFPLTHLWFLYLLVIFYAVCIPLTVLMRLVDRGDLTGRALDIVTRWLARTPLGLILLALPVTAWFVTAPQWWSFFGIPTPDIGLVPNTGALLAYGLAFGAGWAVHRCSDVVLAAWKRSWFINLAAALALTVWLVMENGLIPDFMNPIAPGLDRLPVAAGYTLATWTWTFGLTGAALVVFERPSRIWRYLADSSYWVYLMHLPLVMALQVLVFDWPFPAAIKLVGILAVTMAVLLLSYQFLVRKTWLGGWLNGRRQGRAPATSSQDSPVTAPAG